MATYQKDVTQNLTPATADVSPLIQGKRMAYEAQVATAKADAEMYQGVANLAGTAFKGYQEYQQGVVEQQARDLQQEFFVSNQAARVAGKQVAGLEAMRPAAGGAIAEGMLGGNVDAARAQLKGFEDEVARLKRAAQGGMSNEQYVTRIDALTKDAIASYPGSSDTIREIVGKETGMASADRWAQEQFVKDRFNTTGTTGSATSSDKMAVDDIKAAAATGMFGTAEELTNLRAGDFQEYSNRMQAFQAHRAAATQTAAIETHVKGLSAQTDLEADTNRAVFPAMVAASLQQNVMTNVMLDKNKVYADTLTAMASGKSPTVDPVAFEVQVKMHSAMMVSAIEEARRVGYNQLDVYFANNPNLSDGKRAEMRKDIDTAVDVQLKQFQDNNAGSLVAMAGIMSQYRDKGMEEKSKLYDLAIKQQNSMSNNPLVMAYWASNESRENLRKSNPSFHAFMVDQEKQLASLQFGIRNDVQGAMNLGTVSTAVNAAMKRGTSVVPDDNITPEQTKAVHESVMATAMQALQKPTIEPADVNSMRSALSSAVEVGATSKTLAKDYKKIGEGLNTKLSPQELATVKEGVSDSSVVGMRTVTDLKRVLEDKYGVTLQLGVNSMGEISVITPPPQRAMSSEQMSMFNAAKEFTSRAKPILNNLVYGRAAVTQEEPSVVGAEYLDVINNNTPYNGFFDLKPKLPDRGLITTEPPPTEFDTKLEEKLSQMKKIDPLLNIDYVRNAVMKAPADQRESLKKAMGLA